MQNETIQRPGGITVRIIEAINGFRERHGTWPDSMDMDSAVLASLATEMLTPLGFYRVQSKIRISPAGEGMIVARRGGKAYDYGSEEPRWSYQHDAREWLQLDRDPV